MVYIKLEKTDMKILAHMARDMSKEYSIKELSDQLNTPYVKIHNSVHRLADRGMIKKRVLGKSHYCSFDYKSNLDVACFVEAQIARNFLRINKPVKILIENIQERLSIPSYSLVVFGSFAKSTQTKSSDLDLAVITEQRTLEKTERTINAVAETSNIKVHTTAFIYEDFIKMLKSKDVTVGKELAKNHIVLHGCEQFYECIRMSE
ncbi:nucleotidyltransferase domain-containing protein [Candidatus Woesearchaeota archaeon]|nr:nucleotidyltransferase domain-containing protein [Candidatus Woesearchaeota archaeon]